MKKNYLALLLTLFTFLANAQNEFITEWNIPANGIRFPGMGMGYTITWEQVGNPTNTGTISNAVSGQLIAPTPAGTYTVKAVAGGGSFTGFDGNGYFAWSLALRFVRQWGNTVWQTLNFYEFREMDVTATDIPVFANNADIASLFYDCRKLQGNSSFNDWDVSSITNMHGLFSGAILFNQPLNKWNTSNVTRMSNMFNRALSFNQPIGNWDVGKVQFMGLMFSSANSFNQPLMDWNTVSVRDMNSMFWENTTFNQPIGNWNTGNVITMLNMFNGATAFNQPLDGWDTRKVLSMQDMFTNATAFNQSLGSWNLSSIATMVSIDNSGMDCANYSSTLVGWANNPLTPNGKKLVATGLKYNQSALDARNALLAKNWTIEGDTYAPDCMLALPVSFGNISAKLKAGQLLISWETESEQNNDHFIVELSKDGKNFFPLAEISSKAQDGNSDQPLQYQFEVGENEARAILGGALALGFLLMGFSTFKTRRRTITIVVLLAVIVSVLYGCTKNEQAVEATENAPLFVGIKQIDKDGQTKTSKVIQAIRE